MAVQKIHASDDNDKEFFRFFLLKLFNPFIRVQISYTQRARFDPAQNVISRFVTTR